MSNHKPNLVHMLCMLEGIGGTIPDLPIKPKEVDHVAEDGNMALCDACNGIGWDTASNNICPFCWGERQVPTDVDNPTEESTNG